MSALNAEPTPAAMDAATGAAAGASAGAAPAPPEAGGQTLVGRKVGKYQVKREIGRGGMGAVYEAIHESIGQRIAIKVLNEELSLDARHVQRFFDEARAVNIVQHPGLVKVYDFGHLESGTAYITMEFLAGESLQDRLNRLRNAGSWLPLHEALRISRQIASALEAVHGKAIAHRDLKPGNLFIVPDNEAPGGERVKILDFGIAKFYGSEGNSGSAPETEQRHLTTVGKVLGTPVYMSPEQCNGAEQVDDRTDVYALGVIMYQLVSSKLPFDAPAACVIMAKHITELPPSLAEQRPDLPPEVCQLVHGMLAKSSKDRPPMTAVVKELEGILESEQSLASSEWRSMHRMAPRAKKRGLPVPAMIGGLLFFMMTVSLWKIGSQRRAQKAAAAKPAVTAVSTPSTQPAPPPPQVVAAAAPQPAAVAPPSAPAPEDGKGATAAVAPGAGKKKKGTEGKRKLASAGTAPAADTKSGTSNDIPIFR